MTMFTEWFWSQTSAEQAGRRLVRKGYGYCVSYRMSADGRSGWLLEVTA